MVRFINCFEVPEGRDDDFLAVFGEMNAFMSSQPGYVGHQLHRSLDAAARYRFVNVVEWETAADCAAAHGDTFRAMVRNPEWAFFTSTPALYEIVHERRVERANGGAR